MSASVDETGALTMLTAELVDYDWLPGVSPVYVSGAITGTDEAVGQIAIGGIIIDTNSFAISTYPAVGMLVAIAGVQPNPGGVILGLNFLRLDSSAGDDADLSDLASISGSGAKAR